MTDPENTPIVIKSSDFPPKTPRQLEVEVASSVLRQEVVRRIEDASTLEDFLKWHRAASISVEPSDISWMWEYGEPPTANDILAEFNEPMRVKQAQAEAHFVQDMLTRIKELPAKEDKVAICLKQFTIEGGIETHRVLAVFPEDKQIGDPVLDRAQSTRQKQAIVYFDPGSACVSTACRDLLRERGELFYISYKSLVDSYQALQLSGGRANYVLGLEGDVIKKQDPEVYLIVALQGGYANERLHVRVSDFINKGLDS